MLAFAVVFILCMFGVAALIDARDARLGRRRRSSESIMTDRIDLERDMAATQHRGISVPIDNICRDRQRGR